jgi:nitrite reductase/ring-hydroxylating ferredoxin subunit
MGSNNQSNSAHSEAEQIGFDVCSLQVLRAVKGMAFNFCDVNEYQRKYFPLIRRIAVYWDGSKVYATDDNCPHAQASLAHSYIKPGQVECSAHHAIFDLNSGACMDQYTGDVKVYRVDLKEGRVILHTPGLRRC